METNFASCYLPKLLSAAKMEISEYLGLKRGRKKNPKKDNGELETMNFSYEFREKK